MLKEDRLQQAETAQRELDTASERRLIQLWFILEAAQSMSYSVIPSWLAPWLQDIGFIDPDRSDQKSGVNSSQNGMHSDRGTA